MSSFVTFIGWLVVFYLLLGLIIITFDNAQYRAELILDENEVTEDKPWLSWLLCVCLWPLVLIASREEDD